MRLFRIVRFIFSSYSFLEACFITFNYFRILVNNRLFPLRGFEKILNYKVFFPERSFFFGSFTEIFLQGLYSVPSNQAKLKIIDCGTNIGMSTLYFKWRCPNAHIVCFEPNPEVVTFLHKNISENNLKDVKVFPYALGDKNGTVNFYVDPRRKGSTSASVLRHPGSTEDSGVRSISVPLKRLSDFIDCPVNLLKIDIEGNEGFVLEDLEKSSKLKLVEQIYVEYHYNDKEVVYPLGNLLAIFDRGGFDYVINSGFVFPLTQYKNSGRNYIIYAKRKSKT